MMTDHVDYRRKRSFMSFRMSKKAGLLHSTIKCEKEDKNMADFVSESSSHQTSPVNETYSESLDGSDSSCASVKPKKRYLTRVSSFVNKVASKVQVNTNTFNVYSKGKLERSRTVSATDLQSSKPEDYVQFKDSIPGVIGIRNHGNTCFINAVVQCLNHTDILAEYFVLDQYKQDLARCNKINSKKYGTKGEITEHLAVLLKALWTLKYVPEISLNFKNIVEKYETSYRGSNQHDAAEFLMFVLDKVHEDLNTASKRKYKKIKNPYGRPDEVVAAETLANHLRCNNSFVHDLFQAQFRSSLKCPYCLKESNTFDPFLCVSVPIPHKEIVTIFATIVYLNQQPKQVQLGLSIEAKSAIRDLRQQLAKDCGIAVQNLILTEVDGEGFHRTFTDDGSISIIALCDPVYAIELPPYTPPTTEGGIFLLVTWINVVILDSEKVRFGGVYQSQVPRDISYIDLQKLLLKEMMNMVTNETLVAEQMSGLFEIGVDDGSGCVVALDPKLDVPLFHESVEQALALGEPQAGPPHLKLILKWQQDFKNKYIVDDIDHVEEHTSVQELKDHPFHGASVSLHECLQLHTSAEKLSCGDAWHCPTCNRKQQVVKRLMLWSAPQILVIHLKRFKQDSSNTSSTKLTTTVYFPLIGLDISEHVAGKTSFFNNNSFGGVDVLSGVITPWKKNKRFNIQSDEHVYNLYAICNHHGKDLQGGHYTDTPIPFERGRSYGTLPVGSKPPTIERDHSSDNEIACILPEIPCDNAVSDIPNSLQEFDLPVDTFKESKKMGQDEAVLDSEELEDISDVNSSCTKTVLISKCCSNEVPRKEQNVESYCSSHVSAANINFDLHDVEDASEKMLDDFEVTPEVRIQPATPEVIAAHRARASAKRSVVTVTMRPKSPSTGSIISWSHRLSGSSICSRQSDSSLSSNSSLFVETISNCHINNSEKIEVTDVNKEEEVVIYKPSFRNPNKIPSFVVLNTPTASPKSSRPRPSPNCPLHGSGLRRTSKCSDSLSSPKRNIKIHEKYFKSSGSSDVSSQSKRWTLSSVENDVHALHFEEIKSSAKPSVITESTV